MYSFDQDSKILALDSQGFGAMVGWWEYFLIGWVAQSFSLHSELECDIDDFLSFIIRHHTGSLPERKVFAHIHILSVI